MTAQHILVDYFREKSLNNAVVVAPDIGASRRARNIGLILTRRAHQVASDAFIPQILDGLFDVMHQNDMRLIVDIIEPEHQQAAYLQLVGAKRIDGILLSGPRLDDEALRMLEIDGFPWSGAQDFHYEAIAMAHSYFLIRFQLQPCLV